MPFERPEDKPPVKFPIKQAPIPPVRKYEKYPFSQLRPGTEDSFDYVCEGKETTSRAASIIRGAARRAGVYLITRALDTKTVRIWRKK